MRKMDGKTNLRVVKRQPDKRINAIPLIKSFSGLFVHRKLSEEGGVSLAYLLSQEFQDLAQGATGKQDPEFKEISQGFFFKEPGICTSQRWMAGYIWESYIWAVPLTNPVTSSRPPLRK